jgi:NAD(P)-dependent dehydrogenase (short-subunit alcohol dehydrogenase family)
MPLLRHAVASGSDVRVINVSSNAVPILLGRSYEIDWTDRKVYRGEVPAKSAPWRVIYSLFFAADAVRFSVSKLAVVMFAAELQHRFDQEGLSILSVSINPGTADSYGRAPAMLKPALRPLFKSSVITVEEASWNALFFATAEEVKDAKHKGKYHEPGAVITAAHPYADDLEKRTELWDVTTDEINSYFKGKGRQELGPW